MKLCTKCKNNLPISSFYKHKQASDGLSPSCKQCEKLRKANDYKINPTRSKISSSIWNMNNRNRLNTRQRLRRSSNPEAVRKYTRDYKRKSRLDINKRLADYLRNRLYSAVKGNSKNVGLSGYLGCSVSELIQHLESKWQLEMSWENYGRFGWHIDHIVPLDFFDLNTEDGIKKACHYSNLQPMWWLDNLKKGNKTCV